MAKTVAPDFITRAFEFEMDLHKEDTPENAQVRAELRDWYLGNIGMANIPADRRRELVMQTVRGKLEAELGDLPDRLKAVGLWEIESKLLLRDLSPESADHIVKLIEENIHGLQEAIENQNSELSVKHIKAIRRWFQTYLVFWSECHRKPFPNLLRKKSVAEKSPALREKEDVGRFCELVNESVAGLESVQKLWDTPTSGIHLEAEGTKQIIRAYIIQEPANTFIEHPSPQLSRAMQHYLRLRLKEVQAQANTVLEQAKEAFIAEKAQENTSEDS